MADGLNRVMLLGHLGADPELRVTQGGQSVLSMRLATSESYQDKDKVRRERTDWHNLTVWGRRADALAKILHKGSGLFVEGSIRTSSYDDRDGNKRYKVEINCTNIIITGGGGGGEGYDHGGSDDDAPRGGGGYTGGGRPARGGGGGGGARPPGGSDVIRFGRNSGQRLSDVKEVSDLEWYLDALRGNLDKPEKSRYRDETLVNIAAVEDEISTRGGGGGGGGGYAPRRSGGYSGGRGRSAPSAPDPEQSGAPGESSDDGFGGGYGGGSDDDIPF